MRNFFKQPFFDGWRDLLRFLREYWSAYGGKKSFLASPYSHIALLISLVTAAHWWSDGWWESMLAILPSILGFTIGGFAIVLTLGTGTFGAILSSATKPSLPPTDSVFAKLAAAFCHFIVAQFVGILLALFAKGCFKVPAPAFAPWLGSEVAQRFFWFIGWLVCVYALCLSLAMTAWIFSTVKSVVMLQKAEFARAKRKMEAKLRDAQPQRTGSSQGVSEGVQEQIPRASSTA